MTVFILCADSTFLGVFHSGTTQFLDNLADMFQVDGNEQPLVRIIYDDLHIRTDARESELTPAVKEHGEVGLFFLELNHVGIQSRQEQNVVHQLQQRVRVLAYLVHEQCFVSHVVLRLEQLCETNHRVQRRTNLITHVRQEGLFQCFCLLGLLRFNGQLLLRFHHLRHVTAHAEVAFHLPLGIHQRNHIELQPYRTTVLVAYLGLYQQLYGA